MRSPRAVTLVAVLAMLVIAGLTFAAGYLVGHASAPGGAAAHAGPISAAPALAAAPTVATGTMPGAPAATAPGSAAATPASAAAPTPANGPAAASAPPAAAEHAGSAAAAAPGQAVPAALPAPPPVTLLPAMRLASLRAALAQAAADAEPPLEDDPDGAAGPARPSEAESLATSFAAARADPAAGGGGPSYAVELAIFHELESARRLRGDLLARGQSAAIVMEEDEGGRGWYVVTHGTFGNRQLAEQAAYRLWREEGVRGRVVLVMPITDGDGSP